MSFPISGFSSHVVEINLFSDFLMGRPQTELFCEQGCHFSYIMYDQAFSISFRLTLLKMLLLMLFSCILFCLTSLF